MVRLYHQGIAQQLQININVQGNETKTVEGSTTHNTTGSTTIRGSTIDLNP